MTISPRIFLIGSSELDQNALRDYLIHAGTPNWVSDAFGDLEYLTEIMGRLCYKSFEPGLNPNVTKIRKHNVDHIGNIIKSGHGSVLEHAMTHWIFCDVSRILTHELVRHRVGVAISQESLRYVRFTKLEAWRPVCFQRQSIEEKTEQIFDNVLATAIISYYDLLKLAAQSETGEFSLDAFYRLPFNQKKEFTSAARRVLPEGMATNIGWSCNIRELRHIIQMRATPFAEEEIRVVFGKVAEIAFKKWPALFQDMKLSYDPDMLPIVTIESLKS